MPVGPRPFCDTSLDELYTIAIGPMAKQWTVMEHLPSPDKTATGCGCWARARSRGELAEYPRRDNWA